MDGLRERMGALGFGCDEVAAEVSRRYQVRPRQAYRLARGWTLDQVAARFNELAASEGTDPDGQAGMTGSHLCEVEQWPNSARKPSKYVLCLLARVYDTDVLCLLDLADHESLPQYDRLVLMRRMRAETPFGERVLVLAGARGLSLRELARRVPCEVSRLSRVVHGRERPSLLVAARLDDVLEAGGELAALAEAAGAALEEAPERGDAGRLPGEATAPVTGGMSLTLPYVPARLVIEVSGPAANPGLLAGVADDGEVVPGRLALVRGGSPQADGSEAL
jgi:transcriptional regulator with XRE-family HTH domain